MSRRLIWYCDRCPELGRETQIDGDSFFGFGGEWWRIGFCPVCDKELIEQAREFIIKVGIKVPVEDVPGAKPAKAVTPAAKDKPARVDADPENVAECIWCPYTGTVGALQYHVRTVHKFNGFAGAFGEVCPVCGIVPIVKLGAHGKKDHEVANIAALFHKAIQIGDPHGIVAARLKAAA